MNEYDPHPRRGIRRKINTAQVLGATYLEDVPEISPGFQPGTALFDRDWHGMYLMKDHEGWPDELYFEEAKRLIKELGIKTKRPDVVDQV